nr:FkbM family methyltransferase [uncultured Cohaesibacter sp.]
MPIYIDQIEKIFGKSVTGIIQVGASYGQEIEYFVEECGINKILQFEPLPNAFKALEMTAEKYLGQCEFQLINCALGAEEKEAIFHVSEGHGLSSSLLEPTLHLEAFSTVRFDNQIPVLVKRLDDVVADKGQYNCLYIDVQGYELEVFKGGVETLQHISYIITEVSRSALYANSSLIEDLDTFLQQLGFERMYTYWSTKHYGDAAYIRRDLITGGIKSYEFDRKRKGLFPKLIRILNKYLPSRFSWHPPSPFTRSL